MFGSFKSDSKIFKFFRSDRSFLKVLVILIVVIAVLVFIFKFFVASSSQVLKREADKIVSILQTAQAFTKDPLKPSVFGVQLEILGNRVVLFKRPDFEEGNFESQILFLDDSVVISEVNLIDGSDRIIFKKPDGSTYQYGNIILSLEEKPDKKIFISISPNGEIERL